MRAGNDLLLTGMGETVMPKWVRIMLIADAVVVVALAGWGAWAIISAKKKAAKKEENAAE